MTDTLEPQNQTMPVESAPQYAEGDLNELLRTEIAPDGSGREAMPHETIKPPTQQDQRKQQKETTGEDGQQAQASDGQKKPEAKAKPDKSKKKWEVELKKETEPKEGETADPTQSTESAEKGEAPLTRWRELREKEEKLEKEVMPKLSEYEKQIEELKAQIVSEDERKELEEMRQRFSEERLPSDPVYQSEVMAPIQKAEARIASVAKAANLSDIQFQSVLNAVRNTNEVERARAIGRIISEATITEDGEQVPISEKEADKLADIIIRTSDELHDRLWPKQAQMHAEARDAANRVKGLDTQKAAAEKAKAEAEYKAAHDEIYGIYSSNMPMLFEDKEVAEAVKNAKPADTPMERAAQAQALEILAPLAIRYKEALAKISELEASSRARQAAKPSLSSAQTPAPQQANGPSISFEEAIRSDYGLRR